MARARQRYERGESDFERAANFSDAVFAIAMTLLVVGIAVPKVAPSDLGSELRDLETEIISFFISFFVVGLYWRGHHQTFAELKAVDRGWMMLNLCYLAAIAFVPFPTALVGSYGDEPITVVIYATTLTVASGVGAAMFLWANHYDLRRTRLTGRAFTHDVVAQAIPVAVFALSIPLAVAGWSRTLIVWVLIAPFEAVLDRVYPTDELEAAPAESEAGPR